MLTLLQTGIYKECVQTVSNILNSLNKKKDAVIMQSATKEATKIAVNLAKALQNIDTEEKYIAQTNQANEFLVGTITLLQLACKKGEITEQEANLNIIELEKLQNKINAFLKGRKKILILSSCMGQGHMSASKALKQGLESIYGLDYNVEIIDFWEEMNAFFNKATKVAYEGSTKFTPKIYKFIFANTDTKWQMKLINQINYPFVLAKVKKLFEDKDPDLVISTYPIWDYMTADIWKKVKPNSKFLSVVTDSISIHNAWAIADTDFHIVANEDTALSLHKLGVKNEKIKILGFPVRLDFMKETNRKTFLAQQDLDPDKFTILYLPTAQKKKMSVQIMSDLKNNAQDCNIIVITGRDSKLGPSMEKVAQGKNIRMIGWTDRMADFIKSADLVITKAGGATVMECIACAKPMIITSIIPGQEEGNGELIKRYHLGIIPEETNMGIPESVSYIRQNYKQFQKNLEKQSNPKSALKIAEFINSVLL